MRILFVCTGNTCRSPMAEALLKKNTTEHTASSAGLFVLTPSPAAENAKAIMKRYGLDISSHRSRQLTGEMVEKADLILTMTNGHKAALTSVFPGAIPKTFTLPEYAGQNGDIKDPFGGDLALYTECAETIERCLKEANL